MGWFLDDRVLYIAALFCGLAVCGFGCLLSWAQKNQSLRGNPRTLVWMRLALLVNSLLLLWDILHKK